MTNKEEIQKRMQEIQKQFNELQLEFQKLVGKMELLEEQEKETK